MIEVNFDSFTVQNVLKQLILHGHMKDFSVIVQYLGVILILVYHHESSKKWDIGTNNVNTNETQKGAVSKIDAENYH